MSSKVANLIALELGVLIAIMAWLAFSNLRSVQSPPLAQPPTRLVDSFATVAPARQPRLPAPVDYHADLTPEPQPEEAPPQVMQEDEQEVATEPYIDTSLDAGYINQTAPYYAVAEPEPFPILEISHLTRDRRIVPLPPDRRSATCARRFHHDRT